MALRVGSERRQSWQVCAIFSNIGYAKLQPARTTLSFAAQYCICSPEVIACAAQKQTPVRMEIACEGAVRVKHLGHDVSNDSYETVVDAG